MVRASKSQDEIAKTQRLSHEAGVFALLGRILLIALGYTLVGRLGLLLAIPPGYASFFWPASGLAFGMLLFGGYRLWPGIWLGSFLVNLWATGNSTGWELGLNGWIMSACIATGPTCSAILGVWLVRRFIGYPTSLETGRCVLSFLVLAGPVACLMSSTLGVAGLLFFGAIPVDQVVFNLWTWWSGEVLGVMVLVPVLMTFVAQPSGAWRRRRLAVAMPLGLTYLCAIGAYLMVDHIEANRAQLKFNREAKDLLHRLNQVAMSAEAKVKSLEALYASSTFVDDQEFGEFARRHLMGDNTITALEWALRVKKAKRSEVEAKGKKLGYERFFISETNRNGETVRAGDREEYFPVFYLEPLNGNENALGFDLMSDSARRQAMVRARDSGKTAVTSRIRLLQDSRDQGGFLLIYPVFINGKPTATMEDRRANLHGFVVGVFKMEDIFESIFRPSERPNMHIVMRDITGDHDIESLMYCSNSTLDRYAQWRRLANGTSGISRPLQWGKTLDFGGRRWEISFLATPTLMAKQENWVRWMTSVGGVMFTAILGVFLLVLTGRHARIEQEVDQRTRELRAARDMAHAASRSKSEFLANMSHEIRTPMTAILGYAELLEQTDTNASDRRNYVSTIRRNGKHLLEIINDILDLSKIESGKLSLENVNCSPLDLLDEVAELMLAKAEEKGLSLQVNPVFPLPVEIKSDPTRLRQILLNLVGNAIKFTDSGEVKITLYQSRDGAEKQLNFEVRDSGVGISAEHLRHIFDTFTQADTTTTRTHGGTGLGLAISRKLAQRMGGDIDARSGAGVGSTFTLTIDLKDRVVGEALTERPMRNRAVENTELPKEIATELKARVLLTDDTPTNQMLIKRMLEVAGMEVSIAENGTIALKKVAEANKQQNPFDVILMDMQMPVMDGYEATAALRERGIKTPIIALTAHAMSGDREKCIDAGCDNYATKPVDRPTLLGLIAQYVGQPVD